MSTDSLISSTSSSSWSTKNRPFIISVEGNIGSGKSTLLRYLSEHSNEKWIFLQEPVDDWTSIKDKEGVTILEKFYANQEKYSFSFQIMAYISRLAILKKAVEENPGAIIVTERSLFTDKHVFAKMLYDSGKIEDVDYQIYSRWFDTFVNDYPISGYIYVKTEPNICHDRVNIRCRDGEESIPIDYLNSCHKYHEEMLNEGVSGYILTLNGNLEFEKEKESWANKVDKWVSEIINTKENINLLSESPHGCCSIFEYWSDLPIF